MAGKTREHKPPAGPCPQMPVDGPPSGAEGPRFSETLRAPHHLQQASCWVPHPDSDSVKTCIFNKSGEMQILLLWDHWAGTWGQGQSLDKPAGVIFPPGSTRNMGRCVAVRARTPGTPRQRNEDNRPQPKGGGAPLSRSRAEGSYWYPPSWSSQQGSTAIHTVREGPGQVPPQLLSPSPLGLQLVSPVGQPTRSQTVRGSIDAAIEVSLGAQGRKQECPAQRQ